MRAGCWCNYEDKSAHTTTHVPKDIRSYRAIRVRGLVGTINLNDVSRAGWVWGTMSTCAITTLTCAQTQNHVFKNTHNKRHTPTPCDLRVSTPPCHQVRHCIARWMGLGQYEYVLDHHAQKRTSKKSCFQKHTQHTEYGHTVRSARLHSSMPSSTTLYHALGGSRAV